MAYSNVTSRTDAQALIPEDVSADIIGRMPAESAALALFRQVPMATNQQRMPVLSAMPIAYFVNGDTGLKQTTEMAWSNKYLNVEEIASILPIPEAVADDMSFDIWDTVRPFLVEAIGRTLDAAIFFGTNKPSSWPSDIVTAATAAGNNYARGTNNSAAGGLAEDLNQLEGKVEADGFDVNGFVADRRYRARFRSARDTTGQKYMDISPTEVDGQPVRYIMSGLWPTGSGAAELFAGDFKQGILGVRKDITWKLLTEAVIQDANGAIVFNLAQQDMVAMRVVFRCAWQVANPLTYDQPTEGSRYPFAVLTAP